MWRETADIYSSILTGTMDAFASVISNNLNVVMKVLASITILLSVPTIVYGFYGMNVGAGAIFPVLSNLAWRSARISQLASAVERDASIGSKVPFSQS